MASGLGCRGRPEPGYRGTSADVFVDVEPRIRLGSMLEDGSSLVPSTPAMETSIGLPNAAEKMQETRAKSLTRCALEKVESLELP